MTGSFAVYTENMFEIFIAIAGLVFTTYLLDNATHSQSDPAEDETSKAFEVEIEELNGMWYCWCKDEDGYSFVGQSRDKDELEQQFLKFVKQKYQPS